MSTPSVQMSGCFGNVPRHWEMTTLGEVCRRCGGFIQTGPFGSQLHASDYVPVGVPSIMPVNIGDNRLIVGGIARIRESDAERLSRHRVHPGDVVYSRRGDVERRALIRQGQDGWLCGTGCLLVRFGEGVVDPTYASYYLGHPEIRQWIVRHAVGATMPNLNTAIMEAIPFLLPPLPEQRRIAAILGALDDKIELNRRLNETLDAMARALFKSWFVDFDPVHAKAAVRREHPKWTNAQVSRAALPNLDPAVAELFPDSFEDSEIGPLPTGWRVDEIGNVVKVLGGGTPSTKSPEFWEGGTHSFCTPKDMSLLTSRALLDTERRVTDAGLARISSGELPPGTVLLSSRAPIGYLAIAEIPVSVNQGIIAMVCDGPVTNHYVIQWAHANMDAIEANANGSTFMEISKRNFRPLPIVIPADSVLRAFQHRSHDLHRQLVLNLRESGELHRTRDALLPRLLSGELSVTSEVT